MRFMLIGFSIRRVSFTKNVCSNIKLMFKRYNIIYIEHDFIHI